MKAALRPLAPPLVEHVMANLRARDLAEVLATCGSHDPGEQSIGACDRSAFGMVVLGPSGLPAIAMGAIPEWPGVWSVWLLATEEWRASWRIALRWALRSIPVGMRQVGAHRLHVFASADAHDSARMLRRLGFEREGMARRFGARGEDFVLWARVSG